VYVEVAGRLDAIEVKSRQQVVEGQELARLSNVDLQLSIAELEGKRNQYEARLKSLQRVRSEDDQANLEIPQVQETLETIVDQLAQKLRDVDRLVLKAPISGVILPPAETPNKPDGTGQLPMWSGTPLRQKNLGAFMSESVLFCQVGDPTKMEAILIVEQDDVEFIKQGQDVDIKLNELPFMTFSSKISEVSTKELEFAPRHLSSQRGGDLITRMDPSGVERPMNTSYQARANLDDPEGLLTLGLRGKAKVFTKWQTLGERGWRFLTRTFNFKL
jgi:putative peptide zinc metalloprotease protein